MRTVIYTMDMEPITVVELSKFAIDYLDRLGRVRLPVYLPISMMCLIDSPPNQSYSHDLCVDIYAEWFSKNNNGKVIRKMMLFVHEFHEELALALQSTFLPGQGKAVNDERKKAYVKGFSHAWQMFAGTKE